MRANRGRRSDEASAAVVGLIIGIVVFTLTFSYLITVTVDRRSDPKDADSSSHQTQANSLADILFGTGSGWYGSQPCTASKTINTADYDPDAFSDLAVPSPSERFGLGDESCDRSRTDPQTANNLSFAKISNLFNAQT